MKEPQLLQIQAYDYLIDMIKKGELQTDQIYSLNQMASRMGISRTPLRDAVLRLEQERYVDLLPSKGFILHKMTTDDIIETYQLRSALESYCFKQLAIHFDTERGQEYFNKLSRKVELQNTIVQTTYSNEDFARKDYEFHRSIVQYVGNDSMLDIYRRFMYRIFWQNVTSFSQEGRMEDTIKEHTKLLEMIKAKDLIGLDRMLDHHLTIAQNINLELLQTQS